MIQRGAQALGAREPDRRRRGLLALAAVALVAAAAGIAISASHVLSSLEQASVGERFEVWVNNRLGLIFGLKEWYDANLPWVGGRFSLGASRTPNFS